MLRILKPGLQSSLQGAPRLGERHNGVPASGPADSLSMALANRLVGNGLADTCLEITYGDLEARAEADCSIAITGAHGKIHVAGSEAPPHTTINLQKGQRIFIAPPRCGVRAYLALHSGFQADRFMGSPSTYLPARLGGLGGRALREGDLLLARGDPRWDQSLQTPGAFRPAFTTAFSLRTCPSAETGLLDTASAARLFGETFTAGRQATRMGLSLEGHRLQLRSDGLMKSAPVFPGTIQCPGSGTPIILLCDAQTTGGYPRIASVARCDRHLLGQIRPGNTVRLLRRAHEAAAKAFSEKSRFIAGWLQTAGDDGCDWLR